MPQSTVYISTNTYTTAAEEAKYLANLEGLGNNEISLQAGQGLPLSLPWGRKKIRLGTTFHSKLQSTENPWSDETPFVLSDIHMIPKELHAEYGTTSTFKKVKTARQSETGDHLSLGFGIGVGLPFLASASVKGTFDQHIQENKDVSQCLDTEVYVIETHLTDVLYRPKRYLSTRVVGQERSISKDSRG
jgi:hypothetical protein